MLTSALGSKRPLKAISARFPFRLHCSVQYLSPNDERRDWVISEIAHVFKSFCHWALHATEMQLAPSEGSIWHILRISEEPQRVVEAVSVILKISTVPVTVDNVRAAELTTQIQTQIQTLMSHWQPCDEDRQRGSC